MNILRTLSLAALAVVAAGLSSCTDDDNTETIYEYRFTRCYGVVTDLQDTNAETVSSDIAIVMRADWNKGTSMFEVSGLSIGSYKYPVITIQGSKWAQLNNSLWAESKGCTSASLQNMTPLSIDEFNLLWNDRTSLVAAVGTYDPALKYQFVLDGRYKVVGSRQPFCIGGTTVSTAPDGSSFTSDASLYVVSLDFTNRVASIDIANASFAAGMPSLNMQFAGIPFTVDSDANVTLSVDALIPTIADVPQPNYPISGLKCVVNPSQGRSSLEFVCSFRGAPFSVKADLGFDTYQGYIDAVGEQ